MSFLKQFYDQMWTLFSSTTTSTTPPTTIDESAPCRYRLDNDSSATLTLPDGRKLGYAQHGAPNGKAVLYMHGLPGSRIEGTHFESIANQLGARIIGVDRPGYGWSSPCPGHTLLSFMKDVEYLADHLKLDSYGVLGISGGGPWALACATALPATKLKAVSIVCGLGPPDIGMSGADWEHWLGFKFGFPYLSNLVRWWVAQQPEAQLHLSDAERIQHMLNAFNKSKTHHPRDVEVMKDMDFLRVVARTTREAYAHGVDAYVTDGGLMASEFGFRVEDIRPDLPVRLWYGKHDVSVPPNHGVQLAVRLGERACLRVEDETHSSLFVNWKDEFFRDLVELI